MSMTEACKALIVAKTMLGDRFNQTMIINGCQPELTGDEEMTGPQDEAVESLRIPVHSSGSLPLHEELPQQ